MAWTYSLADPAELNAFVREIDPRTLNYTLGSILPDQMRETTEYEFMSVSQVRDEIAQYRAPDTPPKSIGRPGATKQKGAIPPGSVKRPLTEQNRFDLQRMQFGGVSRELLDTLFDDARAVTNSSLGRLELAKGEALTRGQVSFTNDGGFTGVTISYGTTTTITAPTTKWDVIATADPIADMRAQILQWSNANNGQRPAFALTSQSVIDYVLACTTVRDQFRSVYGVSPAMISENQLNGMLNTFGLPPLVAYDVSVNIAGVNTRVTGVKELTWLPAPSVANFGETTHGVTVEAMELVGEGFMAREEAPGITVMVDKHTQPTQIDTVASFVSVPVIKDTAKIGNVTVLT